MTRANNVTMLHLPLIISYTSQCGIAISIIEDYILKSSSGCRVRKVRMQHIKEGTASNFVAVTI